MSMLQSIEYEQDLIIVYRAIRTRNVHRHCKLPNQMARTTTLQKNKWRQYKQTGWIQGKFQPRKWMERIPFWQLNMHAVMWWQFCPGQNFCCSRACDRAGEGKARSQLRRSPFEIVRIVAEFFGGIENKVGKGFHSNQNSKPKFNIIIQNFKRTVAFAARYMFRRFS